MTATDHRSVPYLTGEPNRHDVITLRGVEEHYPIRRASCNGSAGHVRAVDGVDLSIHRGETLGLVGESGCGKTTLGRIVAGLVPATSGGVYFDLDPVTRAELDGLLAAGDQAARARPSPVGEIWTVSTRSARWRSRANGPTAGTRRWSSRTPSPR